MAAIESADFAASAAELASVAHAAPPTFLPDALDLLSALPSQGAESDTASTSTSSVTSMDEDAAPPLAHLASCFNRA